MFEYDLYEDSRHAAEPVQPDIPYQPAANIDRLSYLVWAEHCVECAIPHCYQTCDLYQPRPDSRCRRFVYGVFKNKQFPSFRGYGAELQFKQWAKLEARGNLRMFPAATLRRMERLTEVLSAPMRWIARRLFRITGNWRWQAGYAQLLEKIQFALNRAGASGAPDAFLLEVYNPAREPASLQVRMGWSAHERAKGNGLLQVTPSFHRTVALPPGYSRHEFDHKLLAHVVSAGKAFDCTMLPQGDDTAHLVFLTADFVKYKSSPAPEQSATRQKPVKCVVWDLDNTVWNGILVEDGRVELRPGVRELIEWFDSRGILQSVASKNDHQFAWKKLADLGLAEYLLAPKINWLPKSQNIRKIAAELNIGLDTFAFVDDSPYELEEVASACPEVLCLEPSSLAAFRSHPALQGSDTEDARKRRQYYQEALQRDTEQAGFGENITGFLASCRIVLEIAAYRKEDETRVAELVQRTNQLNYSGAKYTRQQLLDILADPKLEAYVLRCSDKFGDYGTVGFAIVERSGQRLNVLDFMMSCRVQGKFLEQALFDHLRKLDGSEMRQIWVNYRQTERNTPARLVLQSLQFRATDAALGEPEAGLILDDVSSLACGFISVRLPAVPLH